MYKATYIYKYIYLYILAPLLLVLYYFFFVLLLSGLLTMEEEKESGNNSKPEPLITANDDHQDKNVDHDQHTMKNKSANDEEVQGRLQDEHQGGLTSSQIVITDLIRDDLSAVTRKHTTKKRKKD